MFPKVPLMRVEGPIAVSIYFPLSCSAELVSPKALFFLPCANLQVLLSKCFVYSWILTMFTTYQLTLILIVV